MSQVSTNKLCKHGCGNLAKYKNKSGHFTCEQFSAMCPAIKEKNSSGLKNAYKVGIRPPANITYKNLSQESKDSMAWNRGKTSETSTFIQKQIETYNKNKKFHTGNKRLRGVALHPELRWKRNKINYVDSSGNLCVLESLHEFEIAMLLDKNKIYWTRPKRFVLSNKKTYEPDFYLKELDIYLDPKGKWAGKPTNTYQGFSKQQMQLEKIKMCEEEHNIKCLVLWSDDKRSHTWEGILEQIENYLK
jgi:hypothetical protein